MRKILFAFVFMCVIVPCAWADVAINSSTFPDDNFRSYVSTNFDTDGDGVLSDAEIASVIYIDVYRMNISSLKGVEYFTALTGLHCFENQLTEIDVSNNTALTTLWCGQNKLTSLDVSKNTALTKLLCGGNQLMALDVSNNTALTELECYGNQFTSLDVSHNTALTALECHGDQLTTLDLSHNTALTYLHCYNNQLTALDLSNNTALMGLWCLNNSLTELDVSNNTALTTLDCAGNQLTVLDLSSNTALTELQCDNNQLTALDVNSNTALTRLWCSSNQLTELDVSKNTALTNLQCGENQLTALDVSNNTKLAALECSDNQLTTLDVSNNTALTELNCNYQAVSPLTITSTGNSSYPYQLDFSAYMSSDKFANVSSVQGYDSSYNDITTTYANGIAQFTASPASVTYNYATGYNSQSMDVTISDSSGSSSSGNVAIDSANFPDDDFRTYVSSNFDTDSDGVLSASEIANVTAIDVSGSSISSLEGIKYFTALTTLNCQNTSLTSLDVSDNTALATLNCYNSKLAALDVGGNTALTNISCSAQSVSPLRITETGDSEYPYQLDFTNYMTSAQTANVSVVNGYSGSSSFSGTYADGIAKFASKPSSVTYHYATGYSTLIMDVTISGEESSSGGVEINAANFPDETFRTYISTNFDTDSDGTLSDSEIANVDLIDVNSNGSIASLKGIEYFTALTNLDCNGNQLTALDVSSNTALTSLSCHNNQLTALDVSSNTALTWLWCSSNQLTALDVSNNTALTFLACYDNQITALDVSNNTALTELQCGGNQLAALDVSKNTALTSLDCYDNQITALDISSNTALTSLYCPNNQLTALDVSNCTALTELWCYDNQLTTLDVSSNTALTYLGCDSNQLTELDVSNNTALTSLYCYGNQLTALDVSNNTKLAALECSDNQLTALDVSKNTALTYLRCNNNQLTELDVSNNTALTELWCSSNQLTALDVSNNTALADLECSDNQLTTLDVSKNTSLTALYCYGNQITALDVSKNTALIHMGCGGNQLTALDVSKDTALTTLWCYHNQLTTLDLSNNTALTSLDCHSQDVSPLTITSTGDSSYPYQLNFSAYMSSDKFENVSGVQGLDSEGSIIGTTYSDGIAQFTASPAKVTYDYATGYNSQSMDVTISDSSGSSSSGNVAIDSANFPDSVFRSYVSSNFDSDNNGALSDSEISVVDWINVSNMNITSLKGIEHFTQISGLNCENVRITELDLSRNTAVTEVWAMSSDISSINLNNCTSLRKLGLHGNKLTSLDVSGCYALEELHCGDMSISRLVIGSKPSLKQLYCYRNQLAELDVTGCPALTQLHFGGNRISSIDLSKCTALQYLHCWSNLLAELDLSGLTSITDINCADNALRMLDLSGCTSLANVEIGAQSFDAEEIVRTGDANYPYRVNLSSYVTAGNLAKISEVYAYDSSGSAIDVLLQNGTVLFASLPATISYVYDTGHGNMNVSVRYARASVISETPSNVTNPTDDTTSDDTTTGNQTRGTTNRRQIEVNGRRYALYDIKMSWADAKSYCESLGGNLAAITTQEEQDAILSMILSSDAEAYWLGGRKISNGLWYWLDGSEWSYTNWDTSAGQPDNSGEQLLIYGPAYSGSTGNISAYYASDEISRTPGKWGSVSGNTDDALYGFICEWDYKEISVATVTPIPEQYMPGLAEKLAQLVSVDKSEINFITSADIDTSDPREPTQAMREALSRENGIFMAKLNTIKVNKDGWYAFMLTVSDDLVGTNVNDLRLYYAEESEFDPLSVSASFGLMPIVNGVAGGFEITDLFGVKLDTVPKQFIAMMLLSSGKSLSIYIVKILLVLLAGCSAGAGSLIFLAVFIYKKHFRKK